MQPEDTWTPQLLIRFWKNMKKTKNVSFFSELLTPSCWLVLTGCGLTRKQGVMHYSPAALLPCWFLFYFVLPLRWAEKKDPVLPNWSGKKTKQNILLRSGCAIKSTASISPSLFLESNHFCVKTRFMCIYKGAMASHFVRLHFNTRLRICFGQKRFKNTAVDYSQVATGGGSVSRLGTKKYPNHWGQRSEWCRTMLFESFEFL